MQSDEMLFFDAHPDAWPIYAHLREKLLALDENTSIEVKKTQISFKNPRLFAAVSFLPARRAALRPKTYITLTLGLFRPIESARVDVKCEPYPNRWTHHITIGGVGEIDGELLE